MTSRKRIITASVLAAGLLLGLGWLVPAQPARADGFIVVDLPDSADEADITHHRRVIRRHMPLQVKYHHVEADITDNVGVTLIDQVFHNPSERQMEGTYIFPLPDDVVVQRFSMYMNDKEVSGEILDKDKARQIYEDIVRKMKDPALLEYVGSRMYKARVFPIPAHGDVRIKLDYSQVVKASAGLATYTYPLNTEKFSSAPLGEVAVRVRIKSQAPLATVFCPSHEASVDRKSANEYVVGYEAKNVLPDKDFIVSYKTSDEDFAFVLLAHREAGEDGYFMARVAPGSLLGDDRVVPKDICFVIDTSGSMSGKKIEQARDALRFCLDNLNKEDRFNIVAFSTEVRPYHGGLIDASRDNIASARKYASELKAIGGTAINDALLATLEAGQKTKQPKGRPYLIVFLTDGLPTIGEQDVDKIIDNVKGKNTGNVRLFVFGVGNDVNTKLLDRLAEDNHGARQYVSEREDLELKLSAFYTMIANPVLSDVKIEFDAGLGVHDVYPKVLPDLFKGSELVLFGRYGHGKQGKVELVGQCGDETVRMSWDKPFPDHQGSHDYLPRLWASRKIGFLLDEIRLHGEDKELKEEIVSLAKRFGIITPYTSFLVLEDDDARRERGEEVVAWGASRWLGSRSARDAAGRYRADFDQQTGAGSVAASKGLAKMKAGEAPAELETSVRLYMAGPGGEEERAGLGGHADVPIRFVGSRTFYRDGDKWVDSQYSDKAEIVKLVLFSDQYFDLVARHPEAGKYFAIGKHVIVIIDGKAYESVDP